MRDVSGPSLRPALYLFPLCLFVGFLFLAPLWFPPIILQKWWWGGLHLWRFPFLPVAWQCLAPLLPLMIFLAPENAIDRLELGLQKLRSKIPKFAVSPIFLLFAGIFFFWIFRSCNILFGDSIFYVTDLIPGQEESLRGFFLSFDSIGSTLYYSLGFRYAANFLHLDVLTWYNIAGIAFTLGFLVWVYWQKNKGRSLGTPLAIFLLLTGNWAQTTMGSPEHYGPLMLMTTAFAILAVEALRGREPLWKPCLAYALGAFFHLGIGWLFPALLFLIIRRWRSEDPDSRLFAILCLVIPAAITGSLIYFTGFDLSINADSISSRGKLIPLIGPMHPYSGENYQYPTFDPRHLAHILQEILLMGWPGIILLAGTLPNIRRRVFFADPATHFLLIILVATLLFNLLWNPDLELWRDEDLFSSVGLAFCLFGVYTLMSDAGREIPPATRRRIIYATIAGALAWRVPVILYHSVLSQNYLDPTNFGAPWPFVVSYF